MSAHTNSITFTVDDAGRVLITEDGEVITPEEFENAVKESKLIHSQERRVGYRHKAPFHSCAQCRKIATAARMWKAVGK